MRFYSFTISIISISGTIIPINLEPTRMTVRLSGTFPRDGVVETEHVFTIDTTASQHTIEGSTGLGFIALSSTQCLAFRSSSPSKFAIHPTDFRTFMLVAGASMVVNPENPEDLCEDGTMLYIDGGMSQYRIIAKASVGLDESQEAQFDEGNYTVDSTSEFDFLPFSVIQELLNRIIPNRLGDDIPSFFDNCDLGQYPSIEFIVGDKELGDGAQFFFVPRGKFLYYPEDYLELDGNGRCRFKIRGSSDLRFGINFLSKMAVHFNGYQLGICDPRADSQ
jgi:hypothetical protein